MKRIVFPLLLLVFPFAYLYLTRPYRYTVQVLFVCKCIITTLPVFFLFSSTETTWWELCLQRQLGHQLVGRIPSCWRYIYLPASRCNYAWTHFHCWTSHRTHWSYGKRPAIWIIKATTFQFYYSIANCFMAGDLSTNQSRNQVWVHAAVRNG